MSRFNNHGYKKPDCEGPYIRLSVKDQYGKEVFFKIRRTNKLLKLLNAYCDRQCVDINSTSFLFNGRSIRGEQTAHELQVEDCDKIHAILHPSEEHRVHYDQQLAIMLSMEEEIIRLRMKSKENVVDAPKSSEEMSISDMSVDASIDAIKYQSRPSAKDKAPVVDNSSFYFRAGYQSVMRTSMFMKERGSAPPVGGPEATVGDVGIANPIANKLKRIKNASFPDGPSKRIRIDQKAKQTEIAKSPIIPRLFGDDKFVPSWVIRKKRTQAAQKVEQTEIAKSPLYPDCSVMTNLFLHGLFVITIPILSLLFVRNLFVVSFPWLKKLDVARVGVKHPMEKLCKYFTRTGSLPSYVMDKIQSLRGQSGGFLKKSPILQGRTNAEEADLRSPQGEVVGKIVKESVRVVEKPIEHVMEKMMEKEVMEKPTVGGVTFMENVVSVNKSIEKLGEKVFQGGDITVAPLSDVPVGGGGDGEGATGSSLGGGDGGSIDPINVSMDGDNGQGGDALP